MKKVKKNYSLSIIAFFLGIIIAFGIVQLSNNIPDEISMEHKHDHMGHEVHEYAGENPPTLELVITEDSKSGYNVELVTTNFRFAPENVNTVHTDNEGHAHIYINGEKQRLYSNWYHLDHLHADTTEIKVTLNTNDHKDYSVDGNIIEASQTIN